MFNSNGLSWVYPPPETYTTIIAALCKNGVILGADSRTSKMKSVVGNRITDKIALITDKIFCLRSGKASDTQALCDLVKYFVALNKTISGKKPTVKDVANEFHYAIHKHRGTLRSNVIVAGYDKKTGGDIYSISTDGTLLHENLAIAGSGSKYMRALLTDQWKPDMKSTRCVELVKNSIFHSINNDNFSGGVVRVLEVSKYSVRRRIFYNTPNREQVYYVSTPSF